MKRARYTSECSLPLYQRMALELRKELASGMLGEGDRFPSQNELARRFGTNSTTAREAVAILLHDGWLERRFGSGTYVTPRAAQRRVGIFTTLNILQPRTSSFHSLVPHFIREFLAEQGLYADVYIGTSGPGDVQQEPRHQGFLDDVRAGRLSGVVILSSPDTEGWRKWVEGLSIVAVGGHTPFRVDASYEGMVEESVRRLAAQGSRRIGMLVWGGNDLPGVLERSLGEAGLPFHREWVRGGVEPMLGGAGWEVFRELWTAFPEKPDGLIVCDDVLFDDAVIAIDELGIQVPDELRIVTHGNKGFTRRYPFPVTLAQMDPRRYAETLGAMLVRRLRGEPAFPAVEPMAFEWGEVPARVPAARSRCGVPEEAAEPS